MNAYRCRNSKELDLQNGNRHFMSANKYMKRCSTLLVIRKMEIKPIMKCLCMPTIMADMSKTDNTNVSEEMGQLEFS
jgi:hypothetical protein